MSLSLKILDGSGTERTLAAGQSFSMGRGADNDWVLPDPQREISKVHCRIEPEGDGFVLLDLSINGVAIEGETGPMGPGRRHQLETGDVFTIGPYRFAVAAPAAPGQAATPATVLPANVADILGGTTEGSEARAAGAASGDASRWLGTLPTGAAEAGLHQPYGWGEPPRVGSTVLPPDFDQPASDLSDRSEHTPVLHDALRLPDAAGAIPADWLSADDRPALHQGGAPTIAASAAPPAPASELRALFADAARLDPAALAHVPDSALFRRIGEAVRASLDGLDTLEAAQAVAEDACGLPNQAGQGLWSDFFAANRDPILPLLADDAANPTDALGARVAALADRQRRLGRAVAEAAAACDTIAPAAIEEAAQGIGPLRKAAAWTRFAERHAALVPDGKGFGFLLLLRTSFARLVAGQTS